MRYSLMPATDGSGRRYWFGSVETRDAPLGRADFSRKGGTNMGVFGFTALELIKRGAFPIGRAPPYVMLVAFASRRGGDELLVHAGVS